MNDGLPCKHVLHDVDGPLLTHHSLHMLHQPEDGLRRHEGGLGQGGVPGDEGDTSVGINHGIKNLLNGTTTPEQLELLLVLNQSKYLNGR